MIKGIERIFTVTVLVIRLTLIPDRISLVHLSLLSLCSICLTFERYIKMGLNIDSLYRNKLPKLRYCRNDFVLYIKRISSQSICL